MQNVKCADHFNQGETLDYYDQHAVEFAASTKDIEFSAMQEAFLKLLPPHASILDYGCGAGRDTKYFLERGYQVSAMDGSLELCRIASEYTGIAVKHALFEELDECSAYDGIWACSSILHVPKSGLYDIFHRMLQALKTDGVIYTSFKYGESEGERNGRYFSNFTEVSFAEFLEKVPMVRIEKQYVSCDVRPGRGDEKWLNLLLRKVNTDCI